MKRAVIALALCGMARCGVAADVEWLWPEGKMPHPQPHQIAAMTDVSEKPGFVADEHRRPFLEWCEAPDPAKAVKGCMILISGGGYNCCCDVDLVADWRKKYTGLGFQCVNLVYRTGRPKGLPIYQSAWEDGQRAVRLVRRAAAKRGFDPERIGTMSMSAGSHLATLLATSALTPAYAHVDAADDTPCHVNFAITGAIAYALTDGLTEINARDGDAPDVTLDALFKFDAKTAPMCLLHGGADPVSPSASTHVYRRLRQLKVPAELHLFADRPHAFWGANGGDENATAYDNWFGRASEFLCQLGVLGPVAPEVKLMDRYPNDDARGEYAKADVWPAGRVPDVRTNQCSAYIEWHVPKVLKTKAIQIVYSGGCYNFNTPDGFEVTPARRYLNEKGMTVVTMKYRTPRPTGLAKHVSAWQDLQRAVRLVRHEAPSRGLDPNRIGIMGSSAGGHLTFMGATSSRHHAYVPIDDLDNLPCNVQWAVAIYPAYALTDDDGNGYNVKGGNPADVRLTPEFSFDLSTCPMLFVHGDADTVAAMNSVLCWEQLRRMGIQCDLHTLATRKHCFQAKASPGTGSYTYLDRIWEFMNHKGFNR